MRLTTKYPLTIVTMALAAALVTGIVAYQISKKELRLAAERQSVEILESRKTALGRYLNSIEQDLSLLASSTGTQEALRQFIRAWTRIQGSPVEVLQKLYIHDNPHPTGEKEALDQADDGSLYSRVHARFHPWFRQFLEERGYYDIFLFDTQGNLVYTVFKELDFATNLIHGRWRNTDLGRAFRTTSFNKFPGFRAFFDFKPYEPSHGAPASFIATPVFDDEENYMGVLAFQMPIGRINDIMQVSAGMGKTGRAYLVGHDLLVRNDSRFSTASEILKAKKSPEIVHTAMEGRSGVSEITDDNGKDILVTYTSISFAGQAWAIIAEIDLAEILAPVDDMRRFLMLAGLIIGLVVTLLGIWFSAGLSRPIVAMTGIMQRLAERDLDVEVPNSGRADEIGDMEKTLLVFKDNAFQRKLAEAALQESEQRFKSALDNMPGGICMLDGDLNIRVFNELYPKLMHYSPETFQVGRSIADSIRATVDAEALLSDNADAVIEERLDRLRSGRSGGSERSFADGQVVHVSYNALEDGSLVLIATDVTERRRAAQKIEENEALLRDIMDNIAQGVVAFNRDRELLTWNNNYRNILAFPEAFLQPGLANRDMALYLAKRGVYGDGDPEELSAARISQLWKIDGSARIELAMADGGVYDVWSARTPDNGLVITYTDIAERKRAEEDLREARVAAEEATKAKSSFLATMSHEIRTPMNGLMSMAELLTQTKLTDEQLGMATIIRESGESLLVIINDILDFSKIEAGKMELETVELSVLDLVEAVAQLLAPQATEKGLEISAFVDPEIPDRRMGDPVRLRQILLNLTGNAVKFTEKGGVAVHVTAETDNGSAPTLAFRITDTGIGMTEEQRRKLFQPFQQADTSTARKFGGTGLGLTICLRLVEMMGGEIGVDSEPGKGSVFWFKVPLAAAAESAAKPDYDLTGTRVQLAGDSQTLDIAGRYLSHLGAEARLRPAGRAEPFDLVLIDHTQSADGGLAYGRDVLQETTRANGDAVLLTPYGDRSLHAEAAAAGFFASLAKPLRRAELWRIAAAARGLVAREDVALDAGAAADYGPPPDIHEARAAGALILVAEDNATNQVVIRKLLDKLGFAAEIADNGAVAFDMLRANDYGMLLTDCHMPELDGYELTARIREWEELENRPRLPIVALTADALAGTERQCLDAGMDGYLSKPVEMARLDAIIAEWLPAATELRTRPMAQDASEPVAPPDQSDGGAGTDENGLAILDLETILFIFDEVNQEVRDMLGDFVATNRERVDAFHAHMTQGEYEPAQELAHGMKGAANTIGANSFGKLAADIEDGLKTGDTGRVETLAPGLSPAFERLERVIADL